MVALCAYALKYPVCMAVTFTLVEEVGVVHVHEYYGLNSEQTVI